MTKYIYSEDLLLLCFHPDDFDIKPCLVYYELQGYGPIILPEFIDKYGVFDDGWEKADIITGTGQKLFNIHSAEMCEGRHCVIHNPSEHHMRDFKTHWREDRQMMERICPHGVGHPDPDDHEYRASQASDEDKPYISIHGCDGCCFDSPWPQETKDC